MRGVGSVHWLSRGPVQVLHAGLHTAQLPSVSAYRPAGQFDTQLPPSKSGNTLLGQTVRLHLFFVQLVHCELRGPLQVLHDGEQALQIRLRSFPTISG